MLVIYETLQLTCQFEYILNATYQSQYTGEYEYRGKSEKYTEDCVEGTVQCMSVNHPYLQGYKQYIEQTTFTDDQRGYNRINLTWTKYKGGQCPYSEYGIDDCELLFQVTCKDVQGQQMNLIWYTEDSVNDYITSGEVQDVIDVVAIPEGEFPNGVYSTDISDDNNDNNDNNDGDKSNNTGMIVGIVIAVIVVVVIVVIVTWCCCKKKKQNSQTQMRGQNVA